MNITTVEEKSGTLYVRDCMGREISRNWASSLGSFRNACGCYVVFEKGSSIYVYDKNLREVSRRWK